ncbi:MAG: hypothetical protein R2795_15885 [Saprospiraceae bacterium]
MKKILSLIEENYSLWEVLVARALIHSDTIKFNILYHLTKEDEEFLQGLGGSVTEGVRSDKFYATSKIVVFSSKEIEQKMIEFLKNFGYWKNKFIEDPSFWKQNEEILASITHEELVMVEFEYFSDLLENVDLYNITSS